MHRRTLPAPSEPLFALTRSDVGMAPAWSSAESEISGPLTALTQQFGSLESQVAMLQHQLALLTEQLQKEFQWRTSVATRSTESSLDPSAGPSLETTTIPASIDRRKHPRVLPVVEYGAQGRYVVISPDEGLLSLEPDSPEWFAWLATLPSFRFVGRCGRFTAFRGYQSTARTSWWAHRQIHNHSQRRRLGLSTSVTIECLELAASSLQALVL
jgi:hypothetical protein